MESRPGADGLSGPVLCDRGGGVVVQLPPRQHPILRQQLKWVTRGTILAIAPFTLFYVIPYLTGALPTEAMKVSVLSLGIFR